MTTAPTDPNDTIETIFGSYTQEEINQAFEYFVDQAKTTRDKCEEIAQRLDTLRKRIYELRKDPIIDRMCYKIYDIVVDLRKLVLD